VHIAVISPSVDKQHGTERAVAELIERLATQHKDHVDLYAQRVSDLGLESRTATNGSEHGGISWHRIRSIPGPHLVQFLAWLLLNRALRRTQNKKSKAEIVFSPGINATDADVILVHAVFHRIAELQNSQNASALRPLHRKLYYFVLCRLERRIYSNPRVTLAAVSRHTAAQLARYFGRNDVTVIPNGVDGAHFSPVALASMRLQSRQQFCCSPEEFVLVLIGNDWRNKGLQALLQAIAGCKDLSIRLLVVGQDEQVPFRRAAEMLGVEGRVEFFAPVPDIRVFYAAADCLVAPSLEDSFNLPVLEAMSCGLPVVVSPHAGVSHWLDDAQDCIILKDPQNATELAQAIRTLAVNLPLRQAIGANASVTAKKFSWDTHTNEVRKLLLKAAEDRSRGHQN
jgi:UDP-glucose:(heptosyl)LPS alpha-1,3-glucosyltransferase